MLVPGASSGEPTAPLLAPSFSVAQQSGYREDGVYWELDTATFHDDAGGLHRWEFVYTDYTPPGSPTEGRLQHITHYHNGIFTGQSDVAWTPTAVAATVVHSLDYRDWARTGSGHHLEATSPGWDALGGAGGGGGGGGPIMFSGDPCETERLVFIGATFLATPSLYSVFDTVRGSAVTISTARGGSRVLSREGIAEGAIAALASFGASYGAVILLGNVMQSCLSSGGHAPGIVATPE
jgi:hypothetical protein